jgi:CRISPR/Cas system CSM-associated protein Csm2 small subunit
MKKVDDIKFDRKKEIINAVGVLKHILKSTIGKDTKEEDFKTAMQAQKELNKIFDVYSVKDSDQTEDSGEAIGKLRDVIKILQPLYPEVEEVSEIARQCRSEIERKRAER